MENKKTILIADPDAYWTETLAAFLLKTTHNYEVVAADHGFGALKLIKSRRPNVIILEMLLEIHDGLYLLDYIHTGMPDYHPLVYIVSYMPVAELGGLYQRILELCPRCYIAPKPQAAESVVSNLKYMLRVDVFPDQPQNQTQEAVPAVEDTRMEEAIEMLLRRLDSKLFLRRAEAARHALRILLTERPAQFNMTHLYRQVAQATNGTIASAERNLRSFSQSAQANGTAFYKKHFPDRWDNGTFYYTAYRLLCMELGIDWVSPTNPPKKRTAAAPDWRG